MMIASNFVTLNTWPEITTTAPAEIIAQAEEILNNANVSKYIEGPYYRFHNAL